LTDDLNRGLVRKKRANQLLCNARARQNALKFKRAILHECATLRHLVQNSLIKNVVANTIKGAVKIDIEICCVDEDVRGSELYDL
jgi:hypothetical protein